MRTEVDRIVAEALIAFRMDPSYLVKIVEDIEDGRKVRERERAKHERNQRIIALRSQGLTMTKIADIVGMTQPGVRNVLRRSLGSRY